MDAKDQELQNGIEANSNQIGELNSVTRTHTQQLTTLDGAVKQTDDKATQALNVGQTAQRGASQAASQVSALDQKFQNRNHYVVLTQEKVPFKFDSATLDSGSLSTLDQIAQQLKNNADAILVLEGRTDNAGDESYNIQLGERRADAVVRYLVVQQGVAMQRVFKMSFGEDQPVAANDTREGRADNRAVYLKVMGPGSSEQASGALR
jgi:outer membrane protein OmpA-like peptidoglycan-associated protein